MHTTEDAHSNAHMRAHALQQGGHAATSPSSGTPERHLLVPIQKPEQGAPVALYASHLARQGCRARVSLLCVAPEVEVMRSYDGDALAPAEEQPAQMLLSRAARLLGDAGIACEMLVRYGDEDFTVLDVAEQLNCSEIVVADGGPSRMRWILPEFVAGLLGRLLTRDFGARLARHRRNVPVVQLDRHGLPRKATRSPPPDDSRNAPPGGASGGIRPSAAVPPVDDNAPALSLALLAQYARSLRLVWHIGKSGRAGRTAVYLCRSLRHPVASARWASTVLNSTHMHTWAACTPRLLLRPHRPYLNRSYDFATRCQCVRDHYALASQLLQPEAVGLLAHGTCLVLATLSGKDGSSFCLTLRKTEKFDREGEFVLSIMTVDDDRDIYSVVFALGQETGGRSAHIGCMQGPRGPDARTLIRRATRALYGIRPRDVLADALYSLATAWHIRFLYGIGNHNRVFSGSATHADYDGFWRDIGATPMHDGFFLLPPLRQHHSLDEVPSRHRAEYRRRMALRTVTHDRILTVARFVMRDAELRVADGPAPSPRPESDKLALQPAFSFLREVPAIGGQA